VFEFNKCYNSKKKSLQGFVSEKDQVHHPPCPIEKAHYGSLGVTGQHGDAFNGRILMQLRIMHTFFKQRDLQMYACCAEIRCANDYLLISA